MKHNKETPRGLVLIKKLGCFTRKKGLTILIGFAVGIMLISPESKSWLLRQLMHTGLFNAEIENKPPVILDQRPLDFDFEDIQGVVQNTASLRGKVVFINFWASWCPPCVAELPSIEALYLKFKDDDNAFFLMANEDGDLEVAKTFLEKRDYTVPFYKVKNIPDLLYSGTLPTTIVLDKQGGIRFQHKGFANYASEKFIKQMEGLLKE